MAAHPRRERRLPELVVARRTLKLARQRAEAAAARRAGRRRHPEHPRVVRRRRHVRRRVHPLVEVVQARRSGVVVGRVERAPGERRTGAGRQGDVGRRRKI